MYAYLKGIITHMDASSAVIDCNGVGYNIKISLFTYNKLILNEPALIFTHFQVREDVHILYGFIEESEKKMFELLIAVNGVGGNTALAILSALNVHEIQEAIITGKSELIKKVRGIGQKTAERIVLELKDKIDATAVKTSEQAGVQNNQIRSEAILALTSLGFQKSVIEKRVDEILGSNPQISLEELIKISLK